MPIGVLSSYHNLLVCNNIRIFAVSICVSYVKIQKNWFILVHFSKSLFYSFFGL